MEVGDPESSDITVKSELLCEHKLTAGKLKSNHTSENNNKVWKCRICQASFEGVHQDILVRHILDDHIKKTAPTCIVCAESVTLDQTAIEHIKLHASMQCALCNLEDIPTFEALQEHLRDKHSNNKVCPICQTGVDHSEGIVAHVIEHQRKVNKWKCPTCCRYHILPARCYKGMMGADRMMVHNVKLGEFKCCFCPYTAPHKASKVIMRMHMTNYHRDFIQQQQLQAHDQLFVNKQKMVTHVGAVHNKLKPFSCKLCLKSFASEWKRTRHVNMVHQKLKSFSCTLCNKSFASKGCVTAHIATAHHKLKTFFCTLCKQSFAEQSNLNKHIKDCHAGTSKRLCRCCYEWYPAGQLEKHEVLCKKEKEKKGKKGECQFCAQWFSSFPGLIKHELFCSKITRHPVEKKKSPVIFQSKDDTPEQYTVRIIPQISTTTDTGVSLEN